MAQYNLLSRLHFVKGIDPVADAFDGTVYSDIVSLREHTHALFIVHKGVGTTGTSTITVQASDDNAAGNVSAVAFRYKAITTDDVQGVITAAATTGFALTAGSSQAYAVEVDVQELLASGYEYVRLKAVEVVNSPVLAGVMIVLSGNRFGPSATLTTVD
tara:strand:- start:703 stop:1179 length:477 start_codon:yes stop_codon:yes gene_type:complete